MDVARVVVVVAVAIVSSIAPKQRARHGERGGRVVCAVVDHDTAPDEPTEHDDGEEEGGVIFLPRCRLAFAFAFSVENKNKTKGFMSLRRKGSVILGTNYLTNIKGMTQICLAMGAEDLY